MHFLTSSARTPNVIKSPYKGDTYHTITMCLIESMNFDDEAPVHVCILRGLKNDLLLRLTGDTIRALKANSNAQSTEDGKDSDITDVKLRRLLDAIKYIDCGLNELPIVNNGREDYL
ncbi:unnamed protein product [Didymodactylos carnosus]|uniref:Uncharacterized protein n=1 Tax=Didymodactylos carnosus TaxID=1234261 RepID=A0A816CMN4_9BILA|nr:unnamed protein product [Didymodactylos carnosus]CAF4514944.1 unnamed protein product [Didymodactylos carnosus]